jgi:ATP-dependent protease ClpP protease subunit
MAFISNYGNVIIFVGPTNEESCANLKDMLFDLSFKYPEVVLFLQSYGESISSALSVYDHIKTLTCNVIIIADGEVERAATIIFMAGSERYVMPHAVFRPNQGRFTISHQPFTFILDEINNWKHLEKQVQNIYLDEMNKTWEYRRQQPIEKLNGNGDYVVCYNPSQCLHNLIQSEMQLTSQEVIKYGLADDIWTKEIAKRKISL